jgi:hypothetical protein
MPQINVPLGWALPGINAAATAAADNKLRSFFAIWKAMRSSVVVCREYRGPAPAFSPIVRHSSKNNAGPQAAQFVSHQLHALHDGQEVVPIGVLTNRNSRKRASRDDQEIGALVGIARADLL